MSPAEDGCRAPRWQASSSSHGHRLLLALTPEWNLCELNPGLGKPVLWKTRSCFFCKLKSVFWVEGGSDSEQVEDPGPRSYASRF